LVDTVTGQLKPPHELKKILAPYLGQSKPDLITTCGSGVTACVIALALFNCGTKNASIYDGSWAEWGKIE
jgi:thiosulfate/3-mercaptopyruvate sulfurtransferase